MASAGKPSDVSGREVCQISQMLASGMQQKQIIEITGRSAELIRKIAHGLGYQRVGLRPQSDRKDLELEKWLLKNWHWKLSKKQKRAVKWTLITPYHYPAMNRFKGGTK